MDLHLKGTTALITASTSGIGLIIARTFLEEGASIIINGRSQDKLDRQIAILQDKFTGQNIIGFSADMSTDVGLSAFENFMQRKCIKSVDHLILNLGTGKKQGSNLEIGEWQRFFNINLFGAVQLINLLKNSIKSSIVFISSIAGTQAISAPYAYSASKLAVLSFAKKLSVDYAPKGVRVNTVIPGNIYFKGGRWEELLAVNSSILNSYIKKETPLGRFGKPEEIANTVVFLCSDRAAYTTGSTIVIDGGQSKNII
jgi:3-oxoacyl-[acyl-carrier protein] reductase